MSAMIFPEADANEAIKGIYSEIEEVFGKVPIAYINLFRSIIETTPALSPHFQESNSS
jgi:hypothetical protein